MGWTENDAMADFGFIGKGLWQATHALAPQRQESSSTVESNQPKNMDNVKLRGWSLAYNHAGDLIFMHTSGYYWSYIHANSAPGGATFHTAGMRVKSRESDAHFDVMELSEHEDCSRAEMVEYARRWSGYEVTGDEKEFYMAQIEEAKQWIRDCVPLMPEDWEYV